MSRLKEALTIIENTKYNNPIGAAKFAQLFWPNSNMHLKSSNQGNGATRGKAAWLCAGSYFGKLIKKGYAKHDYDFSGYYITELGKEVLKTL